MKFWFGQALSKPKLKRLIGALDITEPTRHFGELSKKMFDNLQQVIWQYNMAPRLIRLTRKTYSIMKPKDVEKLAASYNLSTS